LLTHRQTNKLWQKHNLLGGDNYRAFQLTNSQNAFKLLFCKNSLGGDHYALDQSRASSSYFCNIYLRLRDLMIF